jgi:hypothetical protein
MGSNLRGQNIQPADKISGVAKRSYGTGPLYVVTDRGGRASWYGSGIIPANRPARRG